MVDMAASILAKLKNKAKGEGIPLQQLLNLYRSLLMRWLGKMNFLKSGVVKIGSIGDIHLKICNIYRY